MILSEVGGAAEAGGTGCPGVTKVGAEAFPLGQGREGQVQ